MGRDLAQSAVACVAMTEAERTEFSAYGVSDDRIEVNANGIDPDDYQLENPDVAVARFRLRRSVSAVRALSCS